MTNGQKDKLAGGAIIALTLISVIGIISGVIIAYLGSQDIGAVVAVVSAAIGGIVAIVLREDKANGSRRDQ